MQVGMDGAGPVEEASAPPVVSHVQNYFILCLLHQIISTSGAGTESSSVVSVLSPAALIAPVSGEGLWKCLLKACLLGASGFSPWGVVFLRTCAPLAAGEMSGSSPISGPSPWLFSLLGSLSLPLLQVPFRCRLLRKSFPDPLKWLLSTSPWPTSLCQVTLCSLSEITFFNSLVSLPIMMWVHENRDLVLKRSLEEEVLLAPVLIPCRGRRECPCPAAVGGRCQTPPVLPGRCPVSADMPGVSGQDQS